MNTEVSICLPIYNEAKSIKFVLQEWTKILERLKVRYNIICSEDGSNDGTKQILNSLSKKNKKIINNSSIFKRGYGKAVISGIEKSKSKYIVCIDSDGQCDPGDFLKFWKKRNQNSKFIIIGNRTNRKDGYFRNFISFIFKIFHKILFKHNVTDPSCPYILFQRKHFNLLKKKLVFMKEGFWWGFIAIASQKNFSIKEVKINHRYRIYGKTNVYKLHKIPSIAFRNAFGLIKIKIT